MADVLITMNDGSQYIAHHGVQGMHWGVWNDETKKKYGMYTSAKGDKLRDKAEKKRMKAQKLQTEKAHIEKAMRVNSDKITTAYAKANAHRMKQASKNMRASSLERKADRKRAVGNDRKADKLEKKAGKLAAKAERERDAANREVDKARAVSDKQARYDIAEKKLKAKALKLDVKASKLERKADKADLKQDVKVEKAAKEVRASTENLKVLKGAKEYADASMKREGPSEQDFAKARMRQSRAIRDYLVKTGNNHSDPEKYSRAVDSVLKAAVSESMSISKSGKDSVDAALDKALGTKRGYRYLE